MLLNEAKQILEKQGYRVEPPKYWVVTFGSEDEANEEEYNFANEGGWDSVVNVERVGNKLYIEYNKNIVDVIDEWFGDKAEIVTGTELADLGYIGESKSPVDNFLNQLSKFDVNASRNFWDKFYKTLSELGYSKEESDRIYDNFSSTIRELRSSGKSPEEIAGEVSNMWEEIMFEDNMDEATLTETINNPDEPATKKQLWTLYCLTKQDYRGKDITKGEASDLIGELLANKKSGSNIEKLKKEEKPSDEDSPVKVGEIYHRSWGYSMCINDYYKVLAVKGKKAKVIELAKKAVEGSLMQGRVVPDDNPRSKNEEEKIALIKPDGTLRIKTYGDKYETFYAWDGHSNYEDHMD